MDNKFLTKTLSGITLDGKLSLGENAQIVANNALRVVRDIINERKSFYLKLQEHTRNWMYGDRIKECEEILQELK